MSHIGTITYLRKLLTKINIKLDDESLSEDEVRKLLEDRDSVLEDLRCSSAEAKWDD